MTHGSLFSGIGGFDLAAEWMGWENVFHCEWNEFGKRILNYYWPQAKSYDDITKTDFSIHRGQIDILTGGFPCQPYSAAGKRLGKEDDRHLWPEMLRAIREIQPRYVVGENVRGLTNWNGGMVFDEVQADLEAEGYEVLPFLLPACAVNAPHRRDRIWFVAYCDDGRCKHGQVYNRRSEEATRIGQVSNIIGDTSKSRPTPDTDGSATGTPRSGASVESNGGDGHLQPQQRGGKAELNTGLHELSRDATDTSKKGLQGRQLSGTPDQERQIRGEQPPGSTTKLHQISDWTNFPTQSPVCDGNDGISTRLDGITFPKWRNESIKAGGNAIVPQIAYELFKVIQTMNHETIN